MCTSYTCFDFQRVTSDTPPTLTASLRIRTTFPGTKTVSFIFHLTAAIRTIQYLYHDRDVIFWAKGQEKVNILSSHGIEVHNLEDLGCPRFEELSSITKTTLNKARVFAAWFPFGEEDDISASLDEHHYVY